MKAFISQPMNGRRNEEIKIERQKAVESLKERYGNDIEIIESFFENAPHDAKPLWFLAKAIELLSTADVAYFCKGWETARGCKIENTCAIEYGLEVIEDYR